jgi:DNA ligase-1
MIVQHPTLYKLDSKGKTREWSMESDDGRYRTVAGLVDGQKVISAWTLAIPKNVNRANSTTIEEQAVSEVESHYAKKLRVDYHRDIDNINVDKIFKPMLATGWEKRKDKITFNTPVHVQPKLDGIRCIATAKGLFSRTGSLIVAIPHIMEALKPVFEKFPDAVFDGELYNQELKDDFNKIVSMVRRTKVSDEDLALSKKMVQYHIYDYPTTLADMFSKRYTDLVACLRNVDTTLLHTVPTYIVYNLNEIDTYYEKFLEDGYEGGIIRLDGRYEQKRSNLLIKRKDFEDAEFEIIRIEEGLGNWSGVAKRVFFRNNDGREVGAGLKGTRDYARQVLIDADEYVGKQVTIQFFTRTPDGVPRFPIAKVLHKNKRW